jgi:hypothetical protein
MKILAAALFLAALPGAGGAPQVIQVGEQDLQQVIDAAPPHSTIVANRNQEIEIGRTITINKPLTLVGINARLQTGLAQTPILSVLAEGVRIRDFHLTGNAGSVTQEDSVSRASLIVVRRGRFVIENGETNHSAKDGVMITPLPEFGGIEHGVVRNVTSRGTIRDTVSIGGAGEQGLFVRHLVVENIRAYDCELRGAVEASDGSEYITIRDVYAERCLYGVDIQDHKEPGQVNRHISIEGLHVSKSYFAVRTANRDFGHDGLTIRNVTGTDWPADAEEPFQVRNTSNVLIANVRMHNCPVGPCMCIRNSDNVTLRDISFIDGSHDGPSLRVEDGNNILINNVTILGDAQPQFGVVYRINSNETFAGLRIRNVLAPDVRETGIILENLSDSGRLESYELSDNTATVRKEIPRTANVERPPNIVIILSDDQLPMGIRPEHELYDLRRDPGQLSNAAYNPAYIDELPGGPIAGQD